MVINAILMMTAAVCAFDADLLFSNAFILNCGQSFLCRIYGVSVKVAVAQADFHAQSTSTVYQDAKNIWN